MRFKDNFEKFNNAVVIAPNELHDSFLRLKNIHPDLDFQIMDINQFVSMFMYQYDDRAVIDLLERGCSYREANQLLKLMSSKRCGLLLNDDLKQIRHQLLTDYFLYPIAYPERTFANKTIIISGYHYDEFIKECLKGIDVAEIIRLDCEKAENPIRLYMSFSDIYEEVHYLFNAIAEDIDSGTDINDIYVLGADESYDMLFNDFGRHYGFEIESGTPCDLAHSQTFINYLGMINSGEKEGIFDKLIEDGFPVEDVESIEKMSLRYSGVYDNPDDDLLLLKEICKTKSAYKPVKTNIVRRLNGFVCPQGAHVYIVNFSMGKFPKIVEEDSFFNDEKCSILGFMTTSQKNEETKKELYDLLLSPEIKLISFKKKAFGSEYFESSFVGNLSLEEVKSPLCKYEYADDKGVLFLSSFKDKYRNYLIVDRRLRGLEKEIDIPEYNTFDYRFKRFEIEDKYIKRNYSSSSIKTFNSCPFSYYLNRVLGIETFEKTFASKSGTIYHDFLDCYYNDPFFDEDISWSRCIQTQEVNGYVFTNKERALLEIIHKYALDLIQFNKTHENEIINKTITTESSFKQKLDCRPEVSINGRYDKIIEFGDKSQYYCVIDNKTGSERFDQSMLYYGLSIQLPFYAYFAKHDEKLKDKELVGLYIAPLLSVPLVSDGKKTYKELEEKSFRLDGVFLMDEKALAGFDPNFRDSTYIDGCSVSKKGDFIDRSKPGFGKVKTKEQMDELASRAEQVVLDVDDKVTKGEFDISPIQIKNLFSSCEHCHFKAVCYRDEKDIKRLQNPKGMEDEEEGAENGVD